MNPVEYAHESYAVSRRVRVLSEHFARVIPPNGSLLDVGCGDGHLTARLAQMRPDLKIRGTDVMVRSETAIEVTPFDGVTLPEPDRSVDTVLLVDVLHHAQDPQALLEESARVARHHLVIKDHRLKGLLASQTLRFMDRIGNARFDVALPHHYWTEDQWRIAFERLHLSVESMTRTVGLYPTPLSWFFDRDLHFIARLGFSRS